MNYKFVFIEKKFAVKLERDAKCAPSEIYLHILHAVRALFTLLPTRACFYGFIFIINSNWTLSFSVASTGFVLEPLTILVENLKVCIFNITVDLPTSILNKVNIM